MEQVLEQLVLFRSSNAQKWKFTNCNLSTDEIEVIAGALQDDNAVQELDLSCNNIDDEGARLLATAMKVNASLQTLNLNSNNIGDEGAKSLAAALKEQAFLQTLDLTCNNIGDEGAKLLAQAMEVNTSLQTLYLYIHNSDVKQMIDTALARNKQSKASRPSLTSTSRRASSQAIPNGGPSLTSTSRRASSQAIPNGDSSSPSPSQGSPSQATPKPSGGNLTGAVAPSADLQLEKKGPLLRRPLGELSIAHICPRGRKCPGRTIILDDNDRGTCSLNVLYLDCRHAIDVADPRFSNVSSMTAEQLFESNKGGMQCPVCPADYDPQVVQLQVMCLYCKRRDPRDNLPCFTVNCVDTIQKLYLDLREIVVNDLWSFQPVYSNFAEIAAAGIPHAPLALCHMLGRFNQVFAPEAKLPHGVIEAISLSLKGGALRQKLELKKQVGGSAVYLRIGLVAHHFFDKHTAILELWPRGHRSPIHQHGGCAGAIYVAHGKLRVTLFRSLKDQTIINNPDIPVTQGSYAWLDRANFCAHQVEVFQENAPDSEFALSIHLYMSCIDEFEFARDGTIQKGNPQNDFVWLYQVNDHNDPRVEEVQNNPEKDFQAQVLKKPIVS